MNALKSFLVFSCFAAFLMGSTAYAGQIVYPWRATTSIVEAGESFDVWFSADSGQIVSSVTLRGPYNSVTSSLSLTSGNWVYDQFSGNKYNTLITVKVPNNTPADRYDIILNTSTGQEISLRGVKVIKERADLYYILHISDHHLFQNQYNNESLTRNSLIVDMANIVDPEMVFITGDNVYGCSADEYKRRVGIFYQGEDSLDRKGMNAFNAAVFVTPGNHDCIVCDGFDLAQASDWWNDYHGLQTHHFSYGQGRFMVMNDTWGGHYRTQIEEFSNWIEKSGSGNLRISAGHGRGQMADLDNAVGLTAAFAGHNHGDCKINPNLVNDRHFVYVACALRADSSFRFNLFKIDTKNGGFTALGVKNNKQDSGAYGLPTGYYEALENPEDKDLPAKWQPNLKLTYANNNNGELKENTATIVNKLDTDFPRARIRFVMSKGFSYRVSPGTIEQQFDGDSVRVVDVRVVLSAKSTATVAISPEEEIEDTDTGHQDTDTGHQDTDTDGSTVTDSPEDQQDTDTDKFVGNEGTDSKATDDISSGGKSKSTGTCRYTPTNPNVDGAFFRLLLTLTSF